MNTLESCTVASPNNKSEVCAKFTIERTRQHYLLTSITQPGKEYTFSFWGKSAEEGSINAGGKLFKTSDTWVKYVTTFTATEENFAIYFPTAGTYYIYHAQLELGNKATDWTPSPADVDEEVKEAAKSASNFIEFTEEKGLQIGNKTSGIWEGFRTQITSTAFNILSAAGETLASYGAKLIELGKNAENAVISMCGGKGKVSTTTIGGKTYFEMSSDLIRITGDGGISGCAIIQGNGADGGGQLDVGGGENYGEASMISTADYVDAEGNSKFISAGVQLRSEAYNHQDGSQDAESYCDVAAEYTTIRGFKQVVIEAPEGNVEIQGVNFGSADISNIGDGSLLGAIAALYEQLSSL
ncbi:MAG: hypothetical protein II203_01980 [Phascolarctobacterium sp.]|nr:hypothetical protein [Phascolarctobacterium sp.]